MKGIAPLFLGIFTAFALSWVGLILIPNFQIGHLEPQVDEEGNDPYPAPKSGMADRGRQILKGRAIKGRRQRLNGESAAAHRAITSSNVPFFLAKRGWALIWQILAR